MPGAWHCRWQHYFEQCEIKVGSCRVDVLLNDCQILEIQHSRITAENILSRSQNAADHGKEIFWILDGTSVARPARLSGKKFALFLSASWMHKHFAAAGCKFVFIDVDGQVFMYHPDKTLANIVYTGPPVAADQFVTAARSTLFAAEALFDEVNFMPEVLCPPKLFICDMGAGNGKTFSAIHELPKVFVRDDGHQLHHTVIYLGKTHAIKDVIFAEFRDQLNSMLESGAILSDEVAKKYINIVGLGDAVTTVAIGTVDSFIYALAPAHSRNQLSSSNIFATMCQAISKPGGGISEVGTIYFGKQPVPLNAETLIYVDESQNIDECYGHVFHLLAKQFGVSVIFIGNKLQSIFMEKNMFVMFDRDAHVTHATPVNENIRCKSRVIIDKINAIVPFAKYGLPSVTPRLLDATDTLSEDPSDWLNIPLDGRAFSKVLDKDFESRKTEDQLECQTNAILKIITEDLECAIQLGKARGWSDDDLRTRIPCQFLVIVAFVSEKIFFVQHLADKLHELFLGYFPVTNARTRYAVLHRSEEGRPIDLTESEDKARILSIHASQGTGREYVYALGITEAALRVYSHNCRDLQYESLLHVAVTRAKRKMRFFYFKEITNDEIKLRLCRFDSNIVMPSERTYQFPQMHLRINDFVPHLTESVVQQCLETFDEATQATIADFQHELESTGCSNSEGVVDIELHDIRYAVCMTFLQCMSLTHIMNQCPEETYKSLAIYNHINKIRGYLRNFDNRNFVEIVSSRSEYNKVLFRNSFLRSEHARAKASSIHFIKVPFLVYPGETIAGLDVKIWLKKMAKILYENLLNEELASHTFSSWAELLKWPHVAVFFLYVVQQIEGPNRIFACSQPISNQTLISVCANFIEAPTLQRESSLRNFFASIANIHPKIVAFLNRFQPSTGMMFHPIVCPVLSSIALESHSSMAFVRFRDHALALLHFRPHLSTQDIAIHIGKTFINKMIARACYIVSNAESLLHVRPTCLETMCYGLNVPGSLTVQINLTDSLTKCELEIFFDLLQNVAHTYHCRVAAFLEAQVLSEPRILSNYEFENLVQSIFAKYIKTVPSHIIVAFSDLKRGLLRKRKSIDIDLVQQIFDVTAEKNFVSVADSCFKEELERIPMFSEMQHRTDKMPDS